MALAASKQLRCNYMRSGCASILQQARSTQQSRPLIKNSNRSSCRLLPAAVAVAELADASLGIEALGVVGIAAGGLFGALWNLEKQGSARLQEQLADAQGQVQAAQQQLAKAQQQLEAEVKARKEAEEWKPRLDAAQKELFKVERALELKDGQLAVFMNTARAQIKSLEDSVRDLQKM